MIVIWNNNSYMIYDNQELYILNIISRYIVLFLIFVFGYIFLDICLDVCLDVCF